MPWEVDTERQVSPALRMYFVPLHVSVGSALAVEVAVPVVVILKYISTVS